MAYPQPAYHVQPAVVPLSEPDPIEDLIVRIPPPQILNLFMALFEHYPVHILAVGHVTTVQVQVPHSEIDAAMAIVMQALPQAEFGVAHPIGTL
jgi:hypothetical protein